ncbi:hypothetical protein P153DRAFT_315201 [Dothidotthia symphoricarpi CBS 119687]|uniref:Uncharacterized protein n=1 Tax=Dothidotthia symphoricarpi CBS 119687 TaxID=1392245 RepID=A0A6A6AFH1_9PLEO|nr:uncharacterized protein P153DRAFT_315201 [Dothidotthia symphoricarpi CBS 119687]KAF2129865.1 hypothetical protein P153DRAFT_315201 [Dothidotthia symphoricarpi CBS 119687]
MPLCLSLVAWRISRRTSCLVRQLTYPALIATHRRKQRLSTCTHLSPSATLAHTVSSHSSRPWTCSAIPLHHDGSQLSRNYSAQSSDDGVLPEDHALEEKTEDVVDPLKPDGRVRMQLSRRTRKARRQSQPLYVLESIHNSARDLYTTKPDSRLDLSHTSHQRIKPGGLQRRSSRLTPPRRRVPPHLYPVSIYTVLARYLEHHTTPSETPSDFQHTQRELDWLSSKGFDAADIKPWALSLLNPDSLAAAEIFKPGAESPPFFLIPLFLRREHIKVFALGVVMRHINLRVKDESMDWTTLKILAIRLLRHARKLWPESIPWIAALFTAEATKIHDGVHGLKPLSPQILSGVTQFCNAFLMLISLPTNVNPIKDSLYQEKAQFDVLQFMANCTPAITVTRTGFRSVTRVQLTHTKTTQEKEWAELKGPSWPPWKEDRTAMDEDKGYEFGASRASKILHRMYEAGYTARGWEDVAGIYAGWDTDLSPTIQTRTPLPHFSSQYRDQRHLGHLLWAGRIRTTRTRREAWACFLAHESSGAPAHQEVYMAMFEKLHHLEIKRSSTAEFQPDVIQDPEQPAHVLLPGDMKEVSTDPTSPLHLVHLSESIPTYEQLCDRMCSKRIRPTKRFLAFLLDTCPDFGTVLRMLELAKLDYNGGIGHLLTGTHGNDSSVHHIPGYLLAAFIRFLCRFSRHLHLLPQTPGFVSPEQHAYRFKLNRQYLLEYAYALLSHYQPHYRPAWTAFMEKVLFNKFDPELQLKDQNGNAMGQSTLQYRIIFEMVDKMANIGLDIDDVQFLLLCTVTRYSAQLAHKGTTSIEHAKHILSTGSPRLRAFFRNLVGANADTHTLNPAAKPLPPHVPGPAALHAYVRALGILRDYEGLYSFSTWLAKHHVEVTARAQAQHSGSKMLFRMLVALRAAMGGWLEEGQDKRPKAPQDIVLLVKRQIESVEEWGGWPSQKYVQLYIKGQLKTAAPGVGGR